MKREEPAQALLQAELADVAIRLAEVGRWSYDVESESLYWCEQTHKIFGTSVDDTPSLEHAIRFYHPSDLERIRHAVNECIEHGKPYRLEVMIQTQQGELKHVITMGEPHYQHGKVTAIFGAIQDITEKKQKYEAAEAERAKLSTTLNNLLDGVIIINSKGIVKEYSEPAAAIFGYAAHEVIGKNISMLMPEPYAADHDRYMENYERTGKRRIIGIGREVEGKRKDGTVFPLDLAVTESYFQGEKQYIGTVRDITKQKEAARRIEFLSYYDPLTNLPNRYKFAEEVDQFALQGGVGVLAINLDFFSRINTAHGFQVGDQALRVVAERLRRFVSNTAILAKDIGDRFWFAMRLESKSAQPLLHAAEQLLSTIRGEIQNEEFKHYITASIGASLGSQHESSSELMSHAETALYEAKLNGRDQVSFYRERMTSSVVSEYQLEMGLRQALERQEIECWLQSKYNSEYQVNGAEALIRWRRYDGTLVSPAEFIPLAERLGFIVQLGTWMVRKVAKLLRALQHTPLPSDFRIAVNVSPKQFLQANFVDSIRNAFAEEGVSLSLLTIEITESLLFKNENTVKEKMQALCDSGVLFSIDDFGTGYSNLSRLQLLPVAELKIDRSFIEGIERGPRERALLDTVLQLSKGMKMSTVAEGIESREQAEYVIERGCEQLQGYFLAKPIPSEQWLAVLREQLPTH